MMQKGPAVSSRALSIGGATGNRTPDLYNAIVALSHLSYDPKRSPASAAVIHYSVTP